MELTVTPNAPFGDDHFKKKKKTLKIALLYRLRTSFFSIAIVFPLEQVTQLWGQKQCVFIQCFHQFII